MVFNLVSCQITNNFVHAYSFHLAGSSNYSSNSIAGKSYHFISYHPRLSLLSLSPFPFLPKQSHIHIPHSYTLILLLFIPRYPYTLNHPYPLNLIRLFCIIFLFPPHLNPPKQRKTPPPPVSTTPSHLYFPCSPPPTIPEMNPSSPTTL